MHRLAGVALIMVLAANGAALAAVQTVAVVHSASAAYGDNAIIVHATVDLPNSCWANPRFVEPKSHVQPGPDGAVAITVVADSSEGAGVMCAMIYRPGVDVPPLRWTGYPAKGPTAVRVVGSATPVVAAITGSPTAANSGASVPNPR
jgi:hypothetical protein